MLNEWMEAEAYLGEIDENCRIRPNLLTGKYKGKLNGLREILVVIARTFMFEHMGTTECTPKIRNQCIMALKLWCGFNSEEELEKYREDEDIKRWLKNYPYADCWLKKYFFIFELDKKNSKNWEGYQGEYGKDLDTKYVYQAKSFTYENVLADALAQGELKEYFLAFFKEETLWKSISGGERKLDIRAQSKILKFVAVYLLLVRFHKLPNE